MFLSLHRTIMVTLTVLVLLIVILLLFMNRKAILIGLSGARYRPKVPSEARVFKDIEYAVFQGKPIRLDIYTPESQGRFPLIVWLHSGAWETLDRSCIEQGAMDQVKRGYALASVDYSLSFERKWPAQLFEIRTAILWLKDNSSRYDIDPDQIVVWGMSAGGHLASLIGTTGDAAFAQAAGSGNADRSHRVQGVIAWCAPSDLSRLKGAAYASARQLLGYEPGLDGSKEMPANPMKYVDSEDPPFFILHGGKDNVVPSSQSVELRDALEGAGVPASLRIIEDYSHEDARFNSDSCMEEIRTFLDGLCMRNEGNRDGRAPSIGGDRANVE
jgi:acetyl esterase/lipase